jgi:dipeptide/tripeptide permease
VLYNALSLIPLGTGGIKPFVSSFGAAQFDERDENEVQKKYAFFNWFFFAIKMGSLLGITLMAYIQEKAGWSVGFGNTHNHYHFVYYRPSCRCSSDKNTALLTLFVPSISSS